LSQINIADTQLTEEEIQAAIAVLRSGMLRQGPQCAAFEEAFAARVGAKHAIACANGTAALHLAWMALLEPGDEVLLPSFTFFATASTVAITGAVPVFCDIDPQTLLMDMADAASKVTARTKALCPVHLFGNVCEEAPARALAGKHGLKIVWDAAQAHGARNGGGEVGGWSDMSCYSFYPTKNLFVGEGGMITTDDAAMAEKLRLLRDHGSPQRYTHTVLGLNYRMTDIAGAIGVTQLKRFDGMLAARRENARVMADILAGVPGIRLQRPTDGTEHCWHQFCVVVEPEFGMERDTLADKLREAGVGTGVHYPLGLHQQPVFMEKYGKSSLPVTEATAERILALPVHHGMGVAEARRVAEAIAGLRG